MQTEQRCNVKRVWHLKVPMFMGDVSAGAAATGPTVGATPPSNGHRRKTPGGNDGVFYSSLRNSTRSVCS